MEIAPNIYWLTGGGNFYVCAEDDGITIIDSGMPKNAQKVWDLLAKLGRDRADVKHIVLTHADIDHVGSVAAIQRETEATVYAVAETAVMLPTATLPEHLPALLALMSKPFMRYEPVPKDAIQVIKTGDTLPVLGGLEVIAAPGHTLEHQAFFAPQHGILFAGDALQTMSGRIGLLPKLISADYELVLRSAIELLQRNPATIACGHGKPKSDHSSDELMVLFNKLRQQLEKL